MIDRIEIRTRGPVGRGMARAMRAEQKKAWHAAGVDFAVNNIPRRFTVEHARAANYQPRSGQNLPRGSKQFWRSYFGRKLRYKKTADPFVFSGETRRLARIANVAATSNGVTVRLPSARKLNFHPKYAADFRRTTAQERRETASIYDATLDQGLNSNTDQSTTTITP